MALEHYGTVESVLLYTGVKPADFGLTSTTGGDTAEQKLISLITGWLKEATDIIDRIIGGSYLDSDNVPPGLHNIAVRIVANMCAQAILRRETPVIRIGEFAVRMTDDTIVTPSIKRDLSRYTKRIPLRSFVPNLQED